MNVLLAGDLSLVVLKAPKTGAGDANPSFCLSELDTEPKVIFFPPSASSFPLLLRLVPTGRVPLPNVKLKVPAPDDGAAVLAVKAEIPLPNELAGIFIVNSLLLAVAAVVVGVKAKLDGALEPLGAVKLKEKPPEAPPLSPAALPMPPATEDGVATDVVAAVVTAKDDGFAPNINTSDLVD